MSRVEEGYPLTRRAARRCIVPDCHGPWGTCELHYHKHGCASEFLGDEGCSCGLTAPLRSVDQEGKQQ